MIERKSVSSFKIILYWFILLLILGCVLSFLPQFLFNNFVSLDAFPKLLIALVLGIVTDLLLIFITTNIISKRYKTSHKTKLLLTLIIMIFSLIITFTNYYSYILDVKDIFSNYFDEIFPSFVSYAYFLSLVFIYVIILVPRLISVLFVSKKLYVEEVVLQQELPKYKIESEEPVYQKVDTTTNQVINGKIETEKEDVWNDDKSLEEKDILIVPEKKEEAVPPIVPTPSISVKPMVQEKKEDFNSDLTKEGAIPFEGLIPGVNPYEKPVEVKKVVNNEPISYPSEHVDRLCPNCGAKVSESATTCFMCGKTL